MSSQTDPDANTGELPGRRPMALAMFDALARDIITGRIAPGTRLDEAGLCRRFGLSRTPVREALHELCARGLAQHIPYRGVQVREIDHGGIEQMFEAMSEMEALCGRLAAVRMTMGQRVALLELHEQMVEMAAAGDAEGYRAHNQAFHDLIWAGCQNPELVALSETIRTRISPFRHYQLSEPGRMLQSCAEHAGICDAILSQNGAAADLALKRHMLSAARELIQNRPTLAKETP